MVRFAASRQPDGVYDKDTRAIPYLNVLSGSVSLNREASRDERHELLKRWAEAAKV